MSGVTFGVSPMAMLPGERRIADGSSIKPHYID